LYEKGICVKVRKIGEEDTVAYIPDDQAYIYFFLTNKMVVSVFIMPTLGFTRQCDTFSLRV